jgi:hypothetical protein
MSSYRVNLISESKYFHFINLDISYNIPYNTLTIIIYPGILYYVAQIMYTSIKLILNGGYVCGIEKI